MTNHDDNVIIIPNAPFLYPLKTLEDLTAFGCFQGVGKRCIGNEWVKMACFIKANYQRRAKLMEGKSEEVI